MLLAHVGRVAEQVSLRGHVVCVGVVELEDARSMLTNFTTTVSPRLKKPGFLVVVVLGFAVGLRAAVVVEVEGEAIDVTVLEDGEQGSDETNRPSVLRRRRR